MAQNSWHRQQADRAAVEIDPDRAEQGLNLAAQVATGAIAIVAIMKGNEVETIVRKQPHAAIEPVQFIHVHKQLGHTVAEPVRLWPEPLVHHNARVEGRRDQAARSSGAKLM